MSNGPRLTTLLWLAARGGRVDHVRMALTALGTALAGLALLCAATVAWIRPGNGPYTSALLRESGLHQGIVAAFVLLCVPLLAFVGQCSRIGAPARDRRLGNLRLAGAIPAEVVRLAATETGLAAAVGSGASVAVYFALRAILGGRVDGEALRLPTDVLPPAWMFAAIVVGLPFGAVMFGRGAMRRIVVSPLGVVRHEASAPPRKLPALLVVLGGTGMALFAAITRLSWLAGRQSGAVLAVFIGLFVVTGVGLGVGAASIAAFLGRSLAGKARFPSVVIACRRLVARPFDASRASTVLLLAGVIGGITLGVRSSIVATVNPTDLGFYLGALDLVNLALFVGIAIAAGSLLVSAAEGLITRRRNLAALVAFGTPKRVLARATLAEVLLPLAPTYALSVVLGLLVTRGFVGNAHVTVYNGGVETAVPAQVPIPWAGMALLVVGGLAVTAAITSVALLFLRSSTDPAELRAT